MDSEFGNAARLLSVVLLLSLEIFMVLHHCEYVLWVNGECHNYSAMSLSLA